MKICPDLSKILHSLNKGTIGNLIERERKKEKTKIERKRCFNYCHNWPLICYALSINLTLNFVKSFLVFIQNPPFSSYIILHKFHCFYWNMCAFLFISHRRNVWFHLEQNCTSFHWNWRVSMIFFTWFASPYIFKIKIIIPLLYEVNWQNPSPCSLNPPLHISAFLMLAKSTFFHLSFDANLMDFWDLCHWAQPALSQRTFSGQLITSLSSVAYSKLLTQPRSHENPILGPFQASRTWLEFVTFPRLDPSRFCGSQRLRKSASDFVSLFCELKRFGSRVGCHSRLASIQTKV